MTDIRLDPELEDPARLDALERDLERFRISRDGWTLGVLGVAILAVFASMLGIGLALRAADDGGGVARPSRPR
ncbi:MAG: hypothetical protein H0U21_08750 [Acidimicrobiia bacterium]|nr:hypothetical protein [Acidimicrobiia bacterium]